MKVWFMYDCHLFASVGDGSTGREQMAAKARTLFSEDGCGSLFARDSKDRDIAHLTGKPLAGGGYGATDAEIEVFFDRVDDHANWDVRG